MARWHIDGIAVAVSVKFGGVRNPVVQRTVPSSMAGVQL
jgi:hypothetical protein